MSDAPEHQRELDPMSKYTMHSLMLEIEGAMLYLSNCASTVVEDMEKRTCWIGEVDVGLMVKVFAAPQVHQGVNRPLQENEVRQRCAQFIAAKLLELVELAEVTQDKIMEFSNNVTEQMPSGFRPVDCLEAQR